MPLKASDRNVKILLACVLLSALLGVPSVVAFAQSSQRVADGAPFSITIYALRDVVKTGAPVNIKVIKTNISDHDLNPPLVSSTRPEFEIKVKDELGNPAPESEWMRRQKQALWQRPSGSVMGGVLKPGARDWQIINVNLYYDMRRPGKYTIQLQRACGKDLVVRSNAITVTVAP